VPAIRRFLSQRHLAVLVCAAALMLKLLVPTGYMISSEQGRIAITPCTGKAAPAAPAAAHGDMADHHGGAKDHEGKPEMPCAFSSLSAQALASVDPLLLAVLIAFVMAAAHRPVLLPSAAEPAHLRPPLRGPPARL
jgi:hypothetical protein